MYLHLGLWLTFYAGFLWNFPIGFIVLYCQFQQFQNFFSWLFIWLIYHSILHPMAFMTLCTYWKFACFWFCCMALYSGGIHGVIRIFLKWLRFVCVYVFQGVACFRENSMDWWMACIPLLLYGILCRYLLHSFLCKMSFKIRVSLLIFYPYNLFLTENDIWNDLSCKKVLGYSHNICANFVLVYLVRKSVF